MQIFSLDNLGWQQNTFVFKLVDSIQLITSSITSQRPKVAKTFFHIHSTLWWNCETNSHCCALYILCILLIVADNYCFLDNSKSDVKECKMELFFMFSKTNFDILRSVRFFICFIVIHSKENVTLVHSNYDMVKKSQNKKSWQNDKIDWFKWTDLDLWSFRSWSNLDYCSTTNMIDLGSVFQGQVLQSRIKL